MCVRERKGEREREKEIESCVAPVREKKCVCERKRKIKREKESDSCVASVREKNVCVCVKIMCMCVKKRDLERQREQFLSCFCERNGCVNVCM